MIEAILLVLVFLVAAIVPVIAIGGLILGAYHAVRVLLEDWDR
jgi:hypothetical protein